MFTMKPNIELIYFEGCPTRNRPGPTCAKLLGLWIWPLFGRNGSKGILRSRNAWSNMDSSPSWSTDGMWPAQREGWWVQAAAPKEHRRLIRSAMLRRRSHGKQDHHRGSENDSVVAGLPGWARLWRFHSGTCRRRL